jgi:hypothetical protein
MPSSGVSTVYSYKINLTKKKKKKKKEHGWIDGSMQEHTALL